MSETVITRPLLPSLQEYISCLEDIWQRKWITNNGYYHARLEDALCKYLSVPYISLFANGTLALIIALKSAGIQGEVITTPYSFVASTQALSWNNITPVFVDIDPETGSMDPDKIEAAITENTSAILPVHVYGNPCEDERISAIAKKHNLQVIYDAAHAFGVRKNNVSILNFGDLSVVSFHATKVFSTIEGGAVVCHDAVMKERMDRLKNFGLEGDLLSASLGLNAKLNEFQSAFGLLTLNQVENVISKRKKVAIIYREALGLKRGLRFIEPATDIRSNYTYFPVFIDEKEYGLSRNEVFDRLRSQDILVKKYFSPLISEMPMYSLLPTAQPQNLPVAHRLSEQVICLPIHHEIEEEEICKVLKCFK